ncbi:Xaa-Pro peptidase family protein [Brevibacillus sp. AG]|uniref:M24 family metallopeptidase n=1 Tax=Brevibacillus sp. AG TaxID=3020891 RepID=UPI000853C58B|nr:Xaa-Pro peptidase family protein [Brevibacillus sp. AG]MDC0762265.1 Xaa-Pro peptidase family protein [Brevibacillus sp. AG]
MEKVTRLREQFDSLGIDGIVITNGQNRRYLTNFTGTYGVVLISRDQAKLFTDFRYTAQAQAQATGFEIVYLPTKESVYSEVARQAEAMGINHLGFEEENVSFALHRKYSEAVQTAFIPTSGVIEGLRMIKTKEELAIIRTAAQIADAAFSHITSFLRPGITELAVSNELEMFMRKEGASGSAFDIIIASGYRSALPHGVASEKMIEAGDMVTLDFGALYQGYRSDITRTVAIGTPDEQLKAIYEIVLEARNRTVAGIRPGITGKEADAFSRDYITEHGYGERFGHGMGHGVGLDIHEEPFMSTRCTAVLQEGMILTVEPGIYIPELGGVRIEDDLVVTESGNEVLTHSPRELIIL